MALPYIGSGVLGSAIVYSLVVIVLPDAGLEAKAFAERVLIALVTGFTGYFVGRRSS